MLSSLNKNPIKSLSNKFVNFRKLFKFSFSSAFWGKVSDKYGRRQALLLSGIYLFVYGILSALSPNFSWMLMLRFLVGFNIGCVPQSVTLFAEFLPTKQRAKCVVLLVRIFIFILQGLLKKLI